MTVTERWYIRGMVYQRWCIKTLVYQTLSRAFELRKERSLRKLSPSYVYFDTRLYAKKARIVADSMGRNVQKYLRITVKNENCLKNWPEFHPKGVKFYYSNESP